MIKKIIYKAKINQVFYPNGKEFLLKNKGLSIKIKGDRELAPEEPVAFYYDSPHYILTIDTRDQKVNRRFIDFKKESDDTLNSFSKWLTDVKGVKTTNPIFHEGYVNNHEVDYTGEKILASGSITLYQAPIKKEVSTDEIENLFEEIDVSNGKLDYLEGLENYFDKRREILLSRDTIGGFVSLYGFLQDVIGASNQKEVDDYIRNMPLYDVKNDRQTAKRNQNYQETVFTWLRNQIGHLDPYTTNYNKVTTEIDNWYEILSEITLNTLQDHRFYKNA